MSTAHDSHTSHEVHRDATRFFVAEEGAVGELTYRLDGDRLTLLHVGVPDSLGGHGVANALVASAVDYARAGTLVVVPWCPFARSWLRAHDDVAKTLTIDWTDRPNLKEAP
jgi:uncharacterized protein